jgi:hypothetical protein
LNLQRPDSGVGVGGLLLDSYSLEGLPALSPLAKRVEQDNYFEGVERGARLVSEKCKRVAFLDVGVLWSLLSICLWILAFRMCPTETIVTGGLAA